MTLKCGLEVTQVIEIGAIRKIACGFLFAFYSWGWAASYLPPPQVADRGTTFRYGGPLQTKRTLVVWRISSGGPAAAVSSERGGGSRVALSTATKYPQALWRHCDMASLSRQKKVISHRCFAVRFLTKARGRSPRQKTEAGSRLRADAEWTPRTASCLPCVCVASYLGKFQLRGPVYGATHSWVACQKRRQLL